MSDDDKELIANEKVLYIGRLSLWTQTYWFLAGLVMMVAFVFLMPMVLGDRMAFMDKIGIGVGLLVWITAYFRYLSVKIVITNKRVILKSGILVRRTNELNMHKTESLQVEQSIAGRMFNYGSVTVSGTGGDHVSINGISNPQELRRAFTEAQNPG